MIREDLSLEIRKSKLVELNTDLVVVGGGMAGVCAAITAARAGINVVLVQDRPILGGNASSEVRLWVLGATSHMGNNNRWAREGGIIDEILVENIFRNKDGNPLIFDTIVLEKVVEEPNITLLLNTSISNIEKSLPDKIEKVYGYCSQNETFYEISAPLFCDASGDGVVSYKAGASYRMGAEKREEFGEKFAPNEDYGELLGHTLYFYSKDTGHPVKFVAPSYALKDIEQIPRYRDIKADKHGCYFWWLEYGGTIDTIHRTEDIKWELWKVVYGVWNYIKNSGEFQNVDNLTLEWVGLIPGKRESRRFEGKYMLVQKDIINQTNFDDAVAFGGWAIDLHPSKGVYSEKSPCTQYHSKGVYQIPYRCYVSKDIANLFFAGRIISASHVAFGSTRVMATGAHGAQAVGMAAALCIQNNWMPGDIIEKNKINCLHKNLALTGQRIPNIALPISNLISKAIFSTSTNLLLKQLIPDDDWVVLSVSLAQLLPLKASVAYAFEIEFNALSNTTLTAQLRYSGKRRNFTPDLILEAVNLSVPQGMHHLKIEFTETLPHDCYAFFTLLKNDEVSIRTSSQRITAILSVYNKFNTAVNNYGKQLPPDDIGVDTFEFWIPERRPKGKNIALNIFPALDCFDYKELKKGYLKPGTSPNAWVASFDDKFPILSLKWNAPVQIHSISLYFDTDLDNPMESVQLGHSESVMPFCVKNYKIFDDQEVLICEMENNHQSLNRIKLDVACNTTALKIVFEQPNILSPVALYGIYIC
ncbi:MAG: FAD-dependent oxidoreductase [Prolixibacteraceae bacterium]|jgi:hypothetical protein|nr:FAD-dependent oxidoreductase [Prolixibacteraceae bacterium]